MDLTRTITYNHKRLYEVNQSTSNHQIDINQISDICNNTDNLNQSNLDQFEDAVCNVLNGINNTYDRKNFKGRTKFALFCSYCSSHGHTKSRCFKRPQREQQSKPRERSFYGHMRNNQNLPNRQINSNNVNGRQLTSTSSVYSNHRSRTPNRKISHPSRQSNQTYNNNNSRYSPRPYSNNRSYSNHRSYSKNRSQSRYNNNNRNRSQSHNRNNNNLHYSNNRNRSNSYQRISNRSNPNNRNNQRYNSRSPYQHSRSPYQSRSPYNRDRNSNSDNGSRYHRNDRNRGPNNQNYRQNSNNENRKNHKPYHRQNGNRIINIEEKPHEMNLEDPPGIEKCN